MSSLLILLQVNTFFKVIQIVILSIAKLIIAPPVSIEMGLSYFETFALTAIGGIIGIFLFYHLSGLVIKIYRRNLKPYFIRLFSKKNKTERIKTGLQPYSARKRISSMRIKTLVKNINRKWGLFGMCLFTIIAIPLVSFFANKYYSKNKYTLVYLSGSVILWSFVVTTLYFYVF